MQNSAPVPAQGEPQSFQLPPAFAHLIFVMPPNPPQSAAQFSFSFSWHVLSPQKGSFACWVLQPIMNITRNESKVIIFFIAAINNINVYLKILSTIGTLRKALNMEF